MIGHEETMRLMRRMIEMPLLEWVVTKPMTKEEWMQVASETWDLTVNHFGLQEPVTCHYLVVKDEEGNDRIVGNIGFSPNSADNARTLAAAWDYLLGTIKYANECV